MGANYPMRYARRRSDGVRVLGADTRSADMAFPTSRKCKCWLSMLKLGGSGHLHAEEVLQADLRDVVGDVLVVIETSTRDVGGPWWLGGVRLQKESTQSIAIEVTCQARTIATPLRSW